MLFSSGVKDWDAENVRLIRTEKAIFYLLNSMAPASISYVWATE
jgi:hypothetical protein